MSQLDLLSSLEPLPAEVPSARLHRLVLVALWNEGRRGLTGEEAAQRCGIATAHSATTRLGEMSKDTKRPDDFPVPLVYHSETKERPTASGRSAYVWFLTDAGRYVAGALAEEAA